MEIEIKLNLTKQEFETLQNELKKQEIPYEEKEQHDTYFSPTSPNFFQKKDNDECLRIRKQNDKYIFGYKHIVFGEKKEDIHFIEHETEIKDVESLKNILKCLNINEIIVLNKKRISYVIDDTVEVSFDEVENLGYFIEIEIIDSKMDVKRANKIIMNYIEKWHLDITKRDLTGYANALYNKLYRIK